MSTTKVELELPLKFYQDSRKKWRWRIKAPGNNKIIAASSEGYTRKLDCAKNLRQQAALLATAVKMVEKYGLGQMSYIR